MLVKNNPHHPHLGPFLLVKSPQFIQIQVVKTDFSVNSKFASGCAYRPPLVRQPREMVTPWQFFVAEKLVSACGPRVFTYIYIYMYNNIIHIYICMYLCMYVCNVWYGMVWLDVCMYVYINIYIYVYVYFNIYILYIYT